MRLSTVRVTVVGLQQGEYVMDLEAPDELLRRLKLGREEYVQRLLTSLILEAPYPRWNSRNEPSTHGLHFLGQVEELSFGTSGHWTAPHFVDELDLPKRHDDEPGSAPDWALVDGERLWMVELKTEAGSHRPGQIPAYYELGRHHFPAHQIDLTYLTGPLDKEPPSIPDGSRFAHVTWDQVFPLIADTWSRSHPDHVVTIGTVLADLQAPWSSWRSERLAESNVPDVSITSEDPVSAGVAVARETARDHQQRAVDLPLGDLESLQQARIELRDALIQDPDLESVRPWIWQTTSGGRPLTPNGAEVGYELRLSWYRPSSA